MRRRLLWVLVLLMGAVVLLLCLPLADGYARSRTEHLLLQRRADAVRFADLAERATTTADRTELTAEIRRYAEVYGAGMTVVDTAGKTVTRAAPETDARADAVGAGAGAGAAGAREALGARARALTGRSTEQLPTIRPWGPRTVTVAEPVGRDERVSGAVLLAVPTRAARHDVAVRWALIGAGAIAAFAAAALVAAGIARWLMRPVRDLDRAVEGLAAGALTSRAAASATGPPELRRLRRQFNAMAETVADSLNRQRAFVADASHQLRNPLATLVLQLENIEPHLNPASADGHAEHLRALEETERLAALLDGLLALARVEAGAGEGAGEGAEARTVQNAEDAVRDRAAAWTPVLAAAGLTVTLTVTVAASCCAVRALPDAVGRVLDALLDNAAKFVPRGGGVEIGVSRREGDAAGVTGGAGPMVVVRVADDGPGAPPDQLPSLLDRFTRGAAHQNIPGSGLGLAIADEIARRSGGRLTAAAREPRGLVVELSLPEAPPVVSQPYTDR
ncbi:HAMP domain-containing sensor histidine kinase [Streptomyces sp. NPDC093109]|uniref:sensor histidine kinase n=1 Tax=Streptomyces sp. NPDC093109 TaxID=3154977 RepID=UPI00344F5A08